MQLTFLGTGAGAPSLQRNVTAIALTLSERGDTWLFDCGEATQHQYLRSQLKPGRLAKIFITHLHGDHIFGLPGLLTSRSMSSISDPLTVYGPPGIKKFIETTLEISGSWASFPLQIVEIDAGIVWQDDQFCVTAYPLAHVIPCFGYRIDRRGKPGVLNTALINEHQIPRGAWLQQIKQGKVVTLPDGRIIDGKAYLGPAQPDTSVAIFGDTAPCQSALELAWQVDVMVHETTLEAAMAEKANQRGHSTTQQAAELAKAAGAKRLIATHFSSRYRLADMPKLLAECQAVFPASELATDMQRFEL